MKDNFLGIFRYLMLLVLAFSLSAGAEAAEAQNQSKVRLSGHIPTNALAKAVFVENLSPNVNVPLTFILPLRNKEGLEALLQRMYDPADEQHYHKYLTTEEFHERFAPTQEDYDKVIDYAKRIGLTITGIHPNRTLLNVSGSTRLIQRAFRLRLEQYQLPSGRKFYAPNNNPQVPVAIASIISGVVGLDNHTVWRPHHRKKETTEDFLVSKAGSQASPSGPGGGYAPEDLVTAYNLKGLSANGSGQVIALFELASYQASDINAYTNYFGLPAAKLKNILVDGGSGSGIDPEVTLDIELAVALAPHSQIYVYEGPNSNQGVLDTYNRIATDNIAKQVSTSWGMGEDNETTQYLQAESAIFQQMAAHGQTIYAAAGDSGAYDDSSSALVVDDPASQPYVVGVGGTKLTVNTSSGDYTSEVVWNDGAGNGAGGGGVSTVWSIPTWQVTVPTLYSKTHRNVPDVALNADPNSGYAIYYNGAWTIYGGTSCAAPLWASFTACVNQELTANHKPTLGFANPALYTIAGGSAYSANFNDVTKGNNLFYAAGKGYDNASGWGSFNGTNLFASLTNFAPITPTVSPELFVSMKHPAPFSKGGTGTYYIAVENKGHGSTTGKVSVVITLPEGLTYKSLSGKGWIFDPATLTCTQDNTLKADSIYPLIELTVNVNKDAPHSVIPKVTVSGGGSASNTTTDKTTTH